MLLDGDLDRRTRGDRELDRYSDVLDREIEVRRSPVARVIPEAGRRAALIGAPAREATRKNRASGLG